MAELEYSPGRYPNWAEVGPLQVVEERVKLREGPLLERLKAMPPQELERVLLRGGGLESLLLRGIEAYLADPELEPVEVPKCQKS